MQLRDEAEREILGVVKLGGGGRFSVADVSLGLRTTSQTETLEDRAMLDGDPYGMGGSMPGGMGTSGTGSTTPTTTTTTGTSTGTGTTATGTTTGTGMTTTGTFLGSVSGGVLRPGGQEWFETFGTDPLSGVVAVHRDLPGGLALSYSSDSALTLPIVTADTTWSVSSLPTGPLTATLKINGVTQSSVVINQTGLVQGSPLRISLQASTPLATGKYDAQIEIVAPMGSYNQMQTLTQQVLVENRAASEFGRGWAVAGLERLIPQTGGTLFVNGAGVRTWFGPDGTAMPGTMATSPLVQQSDMSWRLNRPDGSYHAFDTSGRLTAKVDALGNTVTFGWNVDGLLTSVTDAVGRITTLAYTNGKLNSVTDYAGRFVVLTHGTDGQLTTISSPSSFQIGPWTPPVMTYGYNAAGLIETLTDPTTRSTSLAYSFAGRLATAVLPGGAAWDFAPVALIGLINTATGSGTAANPATRTLPADAIATWTNPLGGIRKLAVDGLGNVIRNVAPDNSETVYTRNANGQILTVTSPDPDGSGPLPSPVTTYVYNAGGLTTQVTLPTGGVRTWTYNAQNLPLTTTNELGQTTSYVWNSNRTLASTTASNGATTSYAYNARGQVTAVTLPDADGSGPLTAVTVTSVYDTLGRRTSQTNPDSTSQSWQYNELDQVTAAIDELGRETQYQYSWMGRVAHIILPDPDGTGPLPAPSVHYNFDDLGRAVSEFKSNVLLKTYVYNVAGQVSSVTLRDPDGVGPLTAATTTMVYDTLGRMSSQTSPGGATSSITFDSMNRVVTTMSPNPDGAGPQLAAVSTFTYDALGRTKTVTDAFGGVTSIGYNAAGFQTSVTDALGHTSSVTYNVDGQVLTSVNALGETTTFGYDAFGNTTSVTLPDPDDSGPLPSPIMTSTYDLFGRSVSTTAPNGGVSTVQYDVNGRVLKQTAADGSFVTMAYDAAGQTMSATQSSGVGFQPAITLATSLTHDNLGRVTTMTDPAGTTSSTFDSAGNVATVTDATGKTSSFSYDLWSRRITATDGLGNVTTTAYNAVGQVGSITDSLDHVTTYAYDTVGRLIISTDANNAATHYEYDRLGRSTKLIDPVGNATTWTYNAIGQMLTDSQLVPGEDAATRSYVYDAVGKVTSRTDRAGRTITFDYDHLGRQTQQNWLTAGAAVNTITTTYNSAMNVASIADNDASNSFTWDIMGRLLTSSNAGTTNAPTVVLSQTYDALGRQNSLSTTINSIADFVNTYSYDTAGRMSQITQTRGVGFQPANSSLTDKRIDMTYDSAGRFASIARYESLTTNDAVATSNYVYDNAGRLTSLQHVAQSSSIAGYAYTWDAADRLTSMTSVIDGLTSYSYDATSQLTGADHTGQTDETFAYDANGNRTNVARVSDAGSSSSSFITGTHNHILNDGTSTYTYDLEGNQTSKTNIATGTKTEYTWNHANQLTAVTFKTSGNVVTKSVAYQYDALGRRIGKSVDDNGDGTMDRRESFVYDGAGLLADAAGSIHIAGPNGALNQAGWTDQLILSFTDPDAGGSQSPVLTARNLYGPAVDQIFATESASGNPLWSLADHQGTPRDWADLNASSTTTIAQHTRYTAFGAIDSITDATGTPLAANASPLPSFTGQLYDSDAGLMYYRARWYDPQIGKFLNDDPMGFAAGDANASRYVRNSTQSAIDPTGLQVRIPPVIIIIYVDPGPPVNAQEPMLYMKPENLPAIEKALNELMRRNELAHIRFTLIDVKPGVNSQLLIDPPSIDAGNYMRYDWFLRMTEASLNNAFFVKTPGENYITGNEINVVRHAAFDPNSYKASMFFANSIAHEVFTFGVLNHTDDLTNTTELTRRAGLQSRYLTMTPEEIAEIMRRTTPKEQ